MARQCINFSELMVLLLLLTACRPSDVGQIATTPAAGNSVRPSLESSALSIDKQKYIWDIEHTAFELEKKFGRALSTAIRQRDPKALQNFCRSGFEASIPDSAKRSSRDLGYLRQVSMEATGEPSRVDVSRFADFLLEQFSEFSQIDKVGCRVLDLHADDRQPATGRWSVTLYLTALGKGKNEAFVELVSEHRLRCTFTDDEEIEAGQILDQWVVRYEKFRYCDRPLFEEVTTAVGLDKVDIRDNWNVAPENARQYYSQMAVEDFDRDGFLDLAVASADGRWRLLKSIAGIRFEEVTQKVGLPSWADEAPHSRSLLDEAYLATWIDFDNDDFPDLILGDQLYQNHQGRRFEDVTAGSGLVFRYNPRGAVVGDYDCDGKLDLYVLYQLPREKNGNAALSWVGDDESGAENELWRNVGNGRFVNTTETSRAGGGRRQTFAAVWLHANDDHYPDLYVANDFGNNNLLINEGNGRFRDVSDAAGVSDYSTSMGVAAGDVTGDGRPEIYVANMFSKMGRRIIAHVAPEDYPPGVFKQIQGACAGNRLYSPTAGVEQYRELSEVLGVNQVGWAYAPAMADFDADGTLDLYATTGFLSFRRDKPDG